MPGKPSVVEFCDRCDNGSHNPLPPPPIGVNLQATSSTLICMPQHRNTANRIFGGFLMHRAYEVAFCAAFMFGGSRPRFSEIDEVRRSSSNASVAHVAWLLGTVCLVQSAF